MADSIVNHYSNVAASSANFNYDKIYDLKNLKSSAGTPDYSMNTQAYAYARIPFTDDQKSEIFRYSNALVYISGSFKLSAFAQGSSSASSDVGILSMSQANITKYGKSENLTTGARRSSISVESTFVDCGMYCNTDGAKLTELYDTKYDPFSFYVRAGGKYNGSSYNSLSRIELSAALTVDVAVWAFGYMPEPFGFFGATKKVDLGST